jgi:hypothetical protein
MAQLIGELLQIFVANAPRFDGFNSSNGLIFFYEGDYL